MTTYYTNIYKDAAGRFTEPTLHTSWDDAVDDVSELGWHRDRNYVTTLCSHSTALQITSEDIRTREDEMRAQEYTIQAESRAYANGRLRP